jgi:hypothetical protein
MLKEATGHKPSLNWYTVIHMSDPGMAKSLHLATISTPPPGSIPVISNSVNGNGSKSVSKGKSRKKTAVVETKTTNIYEHRYRCWINDKAKIMADLKKHVDANYTVDYNVKDYVYCHNRTDATALTFNKKLVHDPKLFNLFSQLMALNILLNASTYHSMSDNIGYGDE